MSVYSIVGLIVLLCMIALGTSAKVYFCKRRKKLDGFHGLFLKNSPSISLTDNWESVKEKKSK